MMSMCMPFNGIDITSIFTRDLVVSGKIDLKTTIKWINKNIEYVSDDTRWDIVDLWQKSPMTLSIKTGDCEDMAILADDILYHSDIQTRMVIGEYSNGGHAWIEAFENGMWLVGEPTNGSVYPKWYAYIIGYIPHVYIYNNECEYLR